MKNEEILDIYDGQNRHIGQKTRSEVHRNGDWHRTFHCWVLCRNEDGVGSIILQRRSEKKSSWPGYVDVSAAGHYQSGETLEDGLRELEEELGVSASLGDLIRLGTRVCIEEFEGNKKNHEFQDVCFLWGQADLGSYRLQGAELSGLMKAPVAAMLELFSKKVDRVDAEGIQLVASDGEFTVKPTTFAIRRELFIPTLDQYNYKIMVLADRALRNEEHLLI